MSATSLAGSITGGGSSALGDIGSHWCDMAEHVTGQRITSVCADLATRFATKVYAPVDEADKLSAKPVCAAPIYPVVSMDPAIAHAGSRKLLLGAAPLVPGLVLLLIVLAVKPAGLFGKMAIKKV